ncbi:hypothetical protein ACQP00_27545 [Dactylosporangium sp. CS-047395]|uniref:hypothetical protein n=1 Tax=Dactylosporangium sp. CS-047395 TaxID=3239936 RepID=UPI003D8C0A02
MADVPEKNVCPSCSRRVNAQSTQASKRISNQIGLEVVRCGNGSCGTVLVRGRDLRLGFTDHTEWVAVERIQLLAG